MLKKCQLYVSPNGTLGLHLSRAPWDPYPWVSAVQDGSAAQRAGVLNGDTVLEMNGRDVLGQKISQIAENIGEHWRSGASYVSVLIWRNQADSVTGADEQKTGEHNTQQQQQQQQQQHQSINQQSLQKFATCLQHIAQLLECPVCLEVIRPPGWQCCNGHVLCNNCRSRSVKCPVCRVPLGPRGRCLMSDKLFTLLAESFPCDGGKSAEYLKNNNSHKISNNNLPAELPRRRKSYQDFSKQAKVATIPKENTIKLEKLAKDQVKYEDIMKETSSRQVDEDAGGKVVEVLEKEPKSRMKETVGHMEKLGQLETNHRPYNSNSKTNNITRICLRRTSREREHQQSKDEHEILKSQKQNFCHNGDTIRYANSNSNSKSENCTGAPTTTGLTVTTRMPVAGTSLTSLSLSSCSMKSNDVEKDAVVVAASAAMAMEARNAENVAISGSRWTLKELEKPKMTKELKSNKHNNNDNDDDDNVIVKLKLKFKSNEKSRDCLMDNSSNKLGYNNNREVIALKNDKKVTSNDNSTLRKSHEIQAADKVVASVNRSSSTITTTTTITKTTTARRMMLQQQKQVVQQQHYQNYYCPTGKSCCCYVQSSTRATLTSAMCAKVAAAAAGADAATAMNKCLSTSSETNNNNNNYNKEHVAKIANVEKSVKDVQQPVEAVAAATATTINLSNMQAAAIDATPNTADSSIVRSATTTTHNNCNCNQKVPVPTTAIATTAWHRAWQLFAHLTEVHRVAVAHYYGVFGTRIRVNIMQSKMMMPCINVSHPITNNSTNNIASEVQQFLLARIPLPTNMTTTSSSTTQEIAGHSSIGNASKYAIFLWHLNEPVNDAAAAVTHNYETIIESSRTGVRWFGIAHALSHKCWSQIQAEGHFLLHAAATAQQVIAQRSWEQRQDAVAVIGAVDDNDDFFDIVIKIK